MPGRAHFMTERKVCGAEAKYFPGAAAIVYLELEPEKMPLIGAGDKKKKTLRNGFGPGSRTGAARAGPFSPEPDRSRWDT